MTQEERIKKIKELDNCSPLKMSSKIIELELYDKKSSQEVIDEIYQEFSNNEDVIDEVLMPCMFTVVDSLFTYYGMDKSKSNDSKVGTTRKKRKQIKKIGKVNEVGITPSRFRNEVKNFSYDLKSKNSENNGVLEQF